MRRDRSLDTSLACCSNSLVEPVSAETAAIVADSLLSGPYDDRAGVACQDDGIMCDGCAGPEHEYRDGSDRQCGFAVLVRRYQRIVRAFDDTLLQIQIWYSFRHSW